MSDQELFIVGVPGMGNSELSWHQRRPYGFSRNGYSKVQALSHAYRRPSTASGRLSSAAAPAFHRPCPPKALAANRSEYWGAGGNRQTFLDYNNSMSRGGYQQQQRQHYSSRRPQGPRGYRVRERSLSAGYRPVSSPSYRSCPTAAAPTTAAVESCTRDRAGIVRGGGRDGRAAPPPTPPPPSSPPAPSSGATGPPWSQKQQQPNSARYATSTSRTPAHCVHRRRPSTAGAMRSSTGVSRECYDYEPTKGVPTEDLAGGGNLAGCSHAEEERRAPIDDAELDARPPLSSIGGGTIACRGHSLSPRVGEGDGPAGGREKRTATAAANIMRHSPTAAAVAAASNLDRIIGYKDDSRDERGTPRAVTGLRRRPASAAPVRSPTINADNGDRDGSDGRGIASSTGDGSNNGFDAVWGADTTPRGRPSVRSDDRGVHRQRPRSASATTRGRPRMCDLGGDERQQSFEASTPGRFDGFQGSPSVARPRPRSASSARPAVVPSFVVSEKQVLRFFGHLSEELDWGCDNASSPILKIRQVVLYLYLADGSLEICEKRQVNSGQQGGLLLKRNLFKKRDGSFYGVDDLKVGSDLKLLGRSYRLTDCDEYTRRWYESHSIRQPEAQPIPKEIGECLRVEQTTGLCNKPKRPNSATSGRPPSAGRAAQDSCSLRRAHQQKVRRFFKHDKETLRFKAVWDDPSPGGTRRRYDLLLFLEDETVSLLNPREDHQNSGRDESMVHVRRQSLPKDWTARSDVYSGGEGVAMVGAGGESGGHNGGGGNGGGGNGGGGDFVGELDLAVGRTVHVWGRKMKLVGCDSFTKAYYRREHGIDMETSLNEDACEQSRCRARRVYHPAGEKHRWAEDKVATETDYLTASLGAYKGAAPSGALPMDRYRGHRIRCKAALRSNMPNDKGREFVITYDLGLDTLMVFELQLRNSGRPGGLFLVKGRHRRPDKNNRYYAPQDLFLGAEVPLVTGHTLIVTEMDRSSLSLCEENAQEFPLMDSRRVLGRIAQRARNMRLALRSELRRRAAGTATKGSGPPFPAAAGGGSVGGIAPRSPVTLTSAAAVANMSWTAGSVLTNGNGSPRQNHPGMRPNAAAAATRPIGGQNYTGQGKESGGAHTGRRVRSGATWGLVGGWGDGYAEADQADAASDSFLGGRGNSPRGSINNRSRSSERRVPLEAQTSYMDAYGVRPRGRKQGGNRKNESATAPWAAVQPAGVNVYTGNSGQAHLSRRIAGAATDVGPAAAAAGAAAAAAAGTRDAKRAGEGRHDDSASCSFQDHAAFRDAMDDLGLLVGLGQQEVLTLIRAFTGKRGKRIEWANMCDRISQMAVAPATTATEVRGEGRHPRATVTTPTDDTAAPLIQRMREAGVAWRSVFARVRDESARGTTYGGGFLGVASLVKAMRQNGLGVGAGDATLLAKYFAKGGGSQVDYNKLCDKIYPCDFSGPSPTALSPTYERGAGYCRTPRAAADLRPPTPAAIATDARRRKTTAGDIDDGEVFSFALPPALPGQGGEGGLTGGTPDADKDGRARAPSCGFELGSGGSGGGVGDDGASGGDGKWSLWDRKDCQPEHDGGSFKGENIDRNASIRGGDKEGGSSQCWDEESAAY